MRNSRKFITLNLRHNTWRLITSHAQCSVPSFGSLNRLANTRSVECKSHVPLGGTIAPQKICISRQRCLLIKVSAQSQRRTIASR